MHEDAGHPGLQGDGQKIVKRGLRSTWGQLTLKKLGK
jgi:hypothetical protein